MADIPAGSLTVKVKANTEPLEKGLDKAKAKVASTDQAITQAGEKASGGFFEATGRVQEFQSKLSASLGVIAGFAAAAQLIGGLADGFKAAADAVEEANGALDGLDKGTAAFLQKVPILNQFANFGRSLALGLGLATDEVKELQEALEATRREQELFKAANSAAAQSLSNQAQIQTLLGNDVESAKLAAEATLQAQLEQVRALRAQAREFAKQEGGGGRAAVVSRRADELEKEAQQIKELTIQAAIRAEEEKEAAAAAAKQAEEQRQIAQAKAEQEKKEKEIVRQKEKAAAAERKAERERIKAADERQKQLEKEAAEILKQQEATKREQQQRLAFEQKIEEQRKKLAAVGATAIGTFSLGVSSSAAPPPPTITDKEAPKQTNLLKSTVNILKAIDRNANGVFA